jgi:hypothetical protein
MRRTYTEQDDVYIRREREKGTTWEQIVQGYDWQGKNVNAAALRTRWHRSQLALDATEVNKPILVHPTTRKRSHSPSSAQTIAESPPKVTTKPPASKSAKLKASPVYTELKSDRAWNDGFGLASLVVPQRRAASNVSQKYLTGDIHRVVHGPTTITPGLAKSAAFHDPNLAKGISLTVFSLHDFERQLRRKFRNFLHS